MRIIRIKNPLVLFLLLPIVLLVLMVLGVFMLGSMLLPKRDPNKPLAESKSKPFKRSMSTIEADYQRLS